jgi:hypothetical protein
VQGWHYYIKDLKDFLNIKIQEFNDSMQQLIYYNFLNFY